MVQEVQNYQFKWMQHVLRMPANCLPQKLLKYKPHGRRAGNDTRTADGKKKTIMSSNPKVALQSQTVETY
jgi:hypothetical protein